MLPDTLKPAVQDAIASAAAAAAASAASAAPMIEVPALSTRSATEINTEGVQFLAQLKNDPTAYSDTVTINDVHYRIREVEDDVLEADDLWATVTAGDLGITIQQLNDLQLSNPEDMKKARAALRQRYNAVLEKGLVTWVGGPPDTAEIRADMTVRVMRKLYRRIIGLSVTGVDDEDF